MLFEAFAILIMLGILSVLIIVHEFGHFSVARLFGFQTPVFGIGLPFGPYWVVGHRWGTQFRIHAMLLGGYVAIPELGDESNAKEENYGVPLQPFKKFPIWQRALVAFAGVGFNMLFAWLVMFTMLASMGEPTQNTVVRRLPAANPIAATAGVKAGDRVVAVDSKVVESPDDIVGYLSSRPSKEITLHVIRDDKPVDITMTTNGNGKVGMELITKGPVSYKKLDANPIALAGIAADKTAKLTGNMLQALGSMVGGMFQKHEGPKHVAGKPPQMGVEDLHGVLMVVALGAEIAKQDWSQLFLFTIMISLDLAIINLVPWPALDGGHLAFMAVEALRGKPMEERAQGEIVKWGFISLLVLMAVIMVNDVRSLITGEFALKMKDRDKEPKIEQPKDQPPATPGEGVLPNKGPDPTAAPPTPETAPAGSSTGTTEKAPTVPETKAPAAPATTPPASTTER